MRPEVRDRVFAGIGTALVIAILGLVLVLGLTVDLRRAGDRALAVLDIQPPPPPPLPPPIRQKLTKPRASGRAAPRNLANKATPVVVTPPIVPPLPPPPIVTALKPGPGAAAETGASDRPGPGQGAGGRGDGNGGGGDGGDGDGEDSPPRQIGGRLRHSDMPPDLAASGADYTVGVRYHVEVSGRVGDCTVARSSGNAALDARVCQLIRQRFRFEPSRDPDGRAVRSTVVENHSFGVDRSDDPNDGR